VEDIHRFGIVVSVRSMDEQLIASSPRPQSLGVGKTSVIETFRI